MLAGKGSSWKRSWKSKVENHGFFAQQWVSFSPQEVRLFLGIPMYFPVGMMMFPRPQFHPWKICQVGHDDVVRRPGAFLWEILLKSCFAYWILSGVITPHTKLRVERTSRWLTLSRGKHPFEKTKKTCGKTALLVFPKWYRNQDPCGISWKHPSQNRENCTFTPKKNQQKLAPSVFFPQTWGLIWNPSRWNRPCFPMTVFGSLPLPWMERHGFAPQSGGEDGRRCLWPEMPTRWYLSMLFGIYAGTTSPEV